MYKWCENVPEKNVLRNCSLGKRTYQTIKNNIYCFIRDRECNLINRKLGGKGLKVQVDETVISHGELPNCPSVIEDNFPGIQWLVGMIEEGTRDFFYAIVPDSTQETFTSLFRQILKLIP